VQNLKKIVGVDLKPRTQMKFLNESPTKEDPRITIYPETSTDCFFKNNVSENETFDCVFIDACHEYKQVLIDYENSFKLVPNDGIIFLHDTYPPDLGKGSLLACGDSYNAYLELKKHKNIDIINLPIWVGLTIIRKHTENILHFL
jgi:predicted O-methyltransferase YrrM